jgi:hypothetical protein
MPPEDDFLSIDELALDKECIRQPGLLYQYSTKLATARQQMDEAKQDYDVTCAEIGRSLRDQAGTADKATKLTETAIQAKIMLNARVRAASDIVADAKHRVDILFAAVNALEHKKSMLSLLVRMMEMDYFSAPREPRGATARTARDDSLQSTASDRTRLVRVGKKLTSARTPEKEKGDENEQS